VGGWQICRSSRGAGELGLGAKAGFVVQTGVDAVDRRVKFGGAGDDHEVRAGTQRLEVAVGGA
jgi:hypothetical protein